MRTNSRIVNTLRYLALSCGGYVAAAWFSSLFVPDYPYAAMNTNWDLVLWAGLLVPPFWASRRDRGWRMKTPFYRVSDDLDLAQRVERLEQRDSSSS